MPEVSELTKKLISQYQKAKEKEVSKPQTPTIHVDEVAAKVASFYEKIRTVVEWREEHLMRRAAIARKLKRRFLDLELNNFSNTENVAESLVLELIRGGHFPNDKIEESKIPYVQNILEKYIFILQNCPENKKGKAGINFYNWLIEVAACEIEECLSPYPKEMALIEYMFESIKPKIKISEKIYQKKLLRKEELNTQIYIAVCQALLKFDKPIISYNLLKQKFPNWVNPSSEFLNTISKKIFNTLQEIEKSFQHPLSNKFYTICEKYDTPFLLLGDILNSEKETEVYKKIEDPSQLENLIRKAYTKRLATLKKRIGRAALYSTISIFVTKILSLIILEILIEKAFGNKINPLMLSGDVLIPTFLMFFIVATVKKPSKNNINIVVLETMKIVYKKDVSDVYEIKIKKPKSVGLKIFLSLLYVASTFFTFGAIYYILRFLGFSIVSIIIDIIFIALILFTGTVVAKRAQELTMEEEKENLLTFLADIFFLPMQGFGKWLSNKWKKYNAIAAFFNALIDMPFSMFVEFLERWRYFIKEKKEEIR